MSVRTTGATAAIILQTICFQYTQSHAAGLEFTCPKDDVQCFAVGDDGRVSVGLNPYGKIAKASRPGLGLRSSSGGSAHAAPLSIGPALTKQQIKELPEKERIYLQRKLISSSFKEEIAAQLRAGGVSALSAAVLSIPSPDGGDGNPNTKMKLKWNKIEVDINETMRSAVLEVTTVKTVETTHPDGSMTSQNYIYYWVIAVERGGLFFAKLKNQDPEEYDGWFRYFARGEKIKVITFAAGKGDTENDLRPVDYFDEDGNLNDLARVYYHSNSDCIEILTKDRFAHGGTYGTNNGNDIRLCAGSCSGYLLAASNGG